MTASELIAKLQELPLVNKPLTRDEILAMPAGPELNMLVYQRVMGLECTATQLMMDGYPQYSKNITDAWRVVEKLRESNVLVRVTNTDQLCECEIYPTWNMGEISIDAYGETAPLAICRVALLSITK